MQTNDLVGEVFFRLCISVNTPIALGAWLRYKYSHTELIAMELNPRDYNSADAFHKDYSVVSFLAKYKGLNTGIDTKAVALQKFTSSEEGCRSANIRLRDARSQLNSGLGPYIHTAQRKIARLLGEYSTFCVYSGYGWGPGAATDVRRREAFVDEKMCKLPIPVSRTSRAMLRNEIENDLHWSASILGTYPEGKFCLLDNVFSCEDTCRIETVPKNAKTDRTIAVEPRGNSFLQKGFGSFIRARLRSVGVDLDNQEVNQEAACRAVSDELATLDLSAASDSISIECVYALLPYDWASALDSVRSRYATLPSGSVVRLEKFSSMGNGFTFELESLIFWALAQSIEDQQGKLALVYGDDIIVSQVSYDPLVALLSFFGFQVNRTKSFSSGQFFESCGKHFFSGIDVTPAYQKEIVDSEPSRIRLANRLLRLFYRLGKDCIPRRFLPAWKYVYRLRTIDTYQPFSDVGDDAYALPVDMYPEPAILKTLLGNKDGWEGVYARLLKHERQCLPAREVALLGYHLRTGSFAEIPTRGDVSVTHDPSGSVVSRWVVPSEQFALAIG